MFRWTALVLVAGFAALWAQDPRGSITGMVRDAQGAVIPGAAITIVNDETNAAMQRTTNERGYFEAALLNAGAYQVSAQATGFKKAVRSGLQLSVAGRLDLEFTLELGQVNESVEVRADAPLLDTTTASGGARDRQPAGH